MFLAPRRGTAAPNKINSLDKSGKEYRCTRLHGFLCQSFPPNFDAASPDRVRHAPKHELLVRRQRTQRPCSLGLMTALGWMSSIVFVAIGPAYTVDAYSGGLRGHCTFIYSEKNKTKKQKLA